MFTLKDKMVNKIINNEGKVINSKNYDYICLKFKDRYIIFKRLFEEMPWERILTIKNFTVNNKKNWIIHDKNELSKDNRIDGELNG